jgi:predicted nucleotidyltransferase
MSEGAYPDWATINARYIAARRAQAIKAARAAAAAAAPFGVKVIVFGSLATGRFHRSSDLDLALQGPETLRWKAIGTVLSAASAEGFEPDIVWLDDAPPRLAERIRETGRDAASLD